MIDKSKYICTTPFGYTEVFDDKQFLCCPGWLKEDIYETNNIKKNFNSKKHNTEKEIGSELLEEIVAYVESDSCRRKKILHYF